MFDLGPIQFLGVAIDKSWRSGPMSAGWLPLYRGMNVLYGLNGAGKSLIIEGLIAALSGQSPARSDGMHMEVIFQFAKDAFKGESGSDDWGDFVYARREISEFLQSFEQPGEDLLGVLDHLDEDGRPWTFIDDILDRVELSLRDSIERSALLPAGIQASEIAKELIRQRMFAFTNPGAGLVVRGMPDDQSPLMTEVIRWRETASEEEGNLNTTSVESIWPSASAELRSLLPPIYEWCYQDWTFGRPDIPLLGLPGSKANRATAEALNEIARRLHTVPKAGPADRLASMSQVLESADKPLGPSETYRSIAEQTADQVWVALNSDGSIDETSAIVSVVEALVAAANRYYSQILIDAPALEIDLGNPRSWLVGDGLLWGARRGPNSPWVALEHLSQAEQRWANIAIELALQVRPEGFLILDEPEQALHRSAEAYMAGGLQKLANDSNLCVVVATHSTEVLNLMESSIHLIRREDQGLVSHRQIHPLSAIDREELRDFGMLPSDLLRRQRGLLLLEGEHDLIVWQALLGDQLDALRVELIPIRGAGKLNSTLDSRVLYDFTDAHLFVILDALNAESVTNIWNEACRIAKIQSAQAGAEYADRELKKLKVDEAQSLAAWASRALAMGRESRHTPITLEAPDVLEYLPVSAFAPNAESWESLREECTRSRGGEAPSGTQFKEWLRKAKRADLSADSVRRAADGMDAIPVEFTNHLEIIRRKLDR